MPLYGAALPTVITPVLESGLYPHGPAGPLVPTSKGYTPPPTTVGYPPRTHARDSYLYTMGMALAVHWLLTRYSPLPVGSGYHGRDSVPCGPLVYR
jgi:hypothetical protein